VHGPAPNSGPNFDQKNMELLVRSSPTKSQLITPKKGEDFSSLQPLHHPHSVYKSWDDQPTQSPKPNKTSKFELGDDAPDSKNDRKLLTKTKASSGKKMFPFRKMSSL
jgi:hypothetical protein